MVLSKTVAPIHIRRQCVLASAFTAVVMTACTAGFSHAQVSLTRNQPSRHGGADAAGQVDSSGKLASYGKLPLSFAANQGQSDSRVRFTSRGSGYSLFLTDSEAVLALSRTDGGEGIGKASSLPKHGLGNSPARVAIETDVVRMQLAGISTAISILLRSTGEWVTHLSPGPFDA
jgi:hypothetical protein